MSKTSTAVKQKYLNKAYSQISIRLPKDLVQAWETSLKDDGIGKAEFLREAIKKYLQGKAGK